MKFKEWRDSIFEALLIILLLFLFCWPVRINGISMENSLHAKDTIAISRVLKYTGAIKKGDIVVFSETIEGDKKHLIKRVIATEGDTVRIKDGNVYVNSEMLSEDYAVGSTMGNFRVVVPEYHYFVMGDNREHSIDSRQLGTIAKKDIVGKAFLKILPIKDIQLY